MSNEDSITLESVAAMLRVSPSTVRNLCDSGKLDFFRTPGGHRRFLKKDVAKYLENCETEQRFLSEQAVDIIRQWGM